MNKILNDDDIAKSRENLLNFFNTAEKGTDMTFDKMHFVKKENWILQQIDEQKKAMKEQVVTIDAVDMGIEKIIVQTIDYLDKNSEGLYPLVFEKRQL